MQKWNIDKDWLKIKYIDEELSTRDIAKLIGCSGKTIQRKLVEYSIQLRTNSEAVKLFRNGKNVLCSNNCGTEIYRKLSKLNKFKVFFCSWKCEKEYQSKTRKVSSFADGWRRYKEYRRWRSHIIKRDKHCKICKSQIKLVAHHILEAKDYPEKVYDETNGVALCQSCHIQIHKEGSFKFIKSLREAILVE